MLRIGVILSAILFMAPVSRAANYFWAQPLNLNLQDVTIANDSSPGAYGFASYSFGGVLQRHSVWDVGDFSGLSNLTPRSTYQASINPNWYGSTSVQLMGHQATLHLHSWSLPSPTPNGWMYMAWHRQINAMAWRADSFGSSPKFCLEHSQAVVGSYSESSIHYAGVNIWLHDKFGRSLQMVVKTWDSRGAVSHSEGAYFDQGGTGFYIGSYYGAGRKYLSLMPLSNSSNNQIWPDARWYGMCIDKNQLAVAIQDLNSKAQGQAALDTDVSSYTVDSVQIHAEIAGLATASQRGGNGWFTLRAAGIYAYTNY